MAEYIIVTLQRSYHIGAHVLMHINSMQLLQRDLLLVSITFPASTIHHGDDKSSFALWKIPDHDLVQD